MAGVDQQIAFCKIKPNFSIYKKFSGHSDFVTALKFNNSSRHLISGSSDRTVRVWDVTTGEQAKQIQCLSAVTCLDVNHSDTCFATGHKTGDIRIFSMSSMEKMHHIQNHQ